MKNKKYIAAGVVALSLLTLSACAKNSDAAKKAFISDAVALNDTKKFDTQEVKVNFDDFNTTSKDSAEATKYIKGSSFDMKAHIDAEAKIVQFDLDANIQKKDYQIGMLMSEKGFYLKSADIKSLYNNFKGLIPEKDAQCAGIYGTMADSLTKPYFFMDSAMMDSSLAKSDTTWESTINKMFQDNAGQPTVDDYTKLLKNVPNSDFTKSGDNVTANLSAENISFSDFAKAFAAATPSLSQEQVESLMKSSKGTEFKTVSIKLTINEKTHEMSGTFEGEMTNTESKDNVNFKISLDAKRSKATDKLTEPATTDAETMQELQTTMMDKLQNQFGN
jgi:hypothetical protein